MIITNGRIVTEGQLLHHKALVIKNGKIAAIEDEKELRTDGCEVLDAKGGYVIPGLIDIHTHGGNGSDVMDATYDDYVNLSRFHASHGVTGIVATTLAAPIPDIQACLRALRPVCGKQIGGATILGAHLEGPFLSHRNRGAHPERFLAIPDEQNVDALLEYRDIIKTITIAPDIENACGAIKRFTQHGIVVSGGHDDSIDTDVLNAMDCGMTHTTHIYCVMSGFSRRENVKRLGLIEMALFRDELSVEVIADKKHTTPLMIRFLYKIKGAKKMCVVSDCLKVAGLPAGDDEYFMGPRGVEEYPKVVVADGVAMLVGKELNAGSVTTLDRMLKILIDECEIPIVEAVRMATLTPAEIIRIDGAKGSIAVGKDADICVMDSAFQVQNTVINGTLFDPKDKKQ